MNKTCARCDVVDKNTKNQEDLVNTLKVQIKELDGKLKLKTNAMDLKDIEIQSLEMQVKILTEHKNDMRDIANNANNMAMHAIQFIQDNIPHHEMQFDNQIEYSAKVIKTLNMANDSNDSDDDE